MRSPGQIVQKFKQASYRHMKRELERRLQRTSQNCVNNVSVKSRSGSLGVCKLDCKTCDAIVDNRAVGCQSFKFEHSAEELKTSLKEFLRTAPAEEIAIRFPDLAVLIWVLDNPDAPERGKLIPDSSPASIWGVDLWVDTPEEVEALVEIARTYEEERDILGMLAQSFGVSPIDLPLTIAKLQKSLEEIAEKPLEGGVENDAEIATQINQANFRSPFWWILDWSWLPWRH